MTYFHGYVAASMLLLTLLALNVSRLRMKLRIGNGDGDNVEMKKAIRAHLNHLEHALPFGLIVLALAQMLAPASLLAVLVVGFLAARLLHAYGMLAGVFRFRQFSAGVTYLFELVGCLVIAARLMA
ncbi:MAPEG family protein [Fontimonas sp. SYSU GA230001]|uniref:MAPEG family protein n=1 Tax=Fontimonas sp. SYSU GA230001 TaxID=3142450 RepID=UPI0032B3960A